MNSSTDTTSQPVPPAAPPQSPKPPQQAQPPSQAPQAPQPPRHIPPSDILITFALPCYNAAAYMDRCIESILAGAKNHLNRVEIIIVDDGSTQDDTAAKADS